MLQPALTLMLNVNGPHGRVYVCTVAYFLPGERGERHIYTSVTGPYCATLHATLHVHVTGSFTQTDSAKYNTASVSCQEPSLKQANMSIPLSWCTALILLIHFAGIGRDLFQHNILWQRHFKCRNKVFVIMQRDNYIKQPTCYATEYDKESFTEFSNVSGQLQVSSAKFWVAQTSRYETSNCFGFVKRKLIALKLINT